MAPPADVVTVLPRGRTVYGMQLPVQSQSTIYVQPWEAEAGPDELAAVALACEAAGFFYVGVCDHTFIPERLAGAMSTTWYDTIATLGWLAGVTSYIRLLSHIYVVALRHPLRVGQGVRHPRRPVRWSGHLRGRRRPRGRGVRPHGTGLRPPGAGHRRGDRGPGPGWCDEYPTLARAELEAVRSRAPAATGAGAPARPSGSAGHHRPRSVAPPASAMGGCPSHSGPTWSCCPSCGGCATSTGTTRRSTSGALPTPSTWARRPPASSCPAARCPDRPEQVADYLRPFREAGVGQVQVRFPSRSADELCDQIAAFGHDVAPLVDA